MTGARMRATISLLAAIVFGVAMGIGGDRLWLRRSMPISMDSPALINEMDRRLHLDATQRTAIAAVLRRNQTAVDSAWGLVRPGFHAIVDSSQREILDVLRPDQRGPYLSWLQAAHHGMGGVMPKH